MSFTFPLFYKHFLHYKFCIRWGGMPEMTLEWALKENGIDPKQDLVIDTSIAFAAMQGAFVGGTGDFVTLFELSVRE